MSTDLESVLLRSGAVTSQTLARSVGLAHARKVSLWELLVLERQVSEETLANAFSTCLNVPRLRLDAIVVEAHVLKLISVRLARKHTCMPVRLYGAALVLAMANPLDRQAIQDVEFTAHRRVRAVVACRSEILQSIDRHYGKEPHRPIDEPRSAETTAPGRAASPVAPAFTAPAWLTVAQLCQRWQLDRKTIYKFIDAGALPAWKVGARLYRVAVDDLLIFEARNRLLTK